MKKIVLNTGFLPEGTIPYKGQYIYKVKGVREGARGLGEGFPQPEFLELELEGVGGINGKLERTIAVNSSNPLNARIHKYFLLEHDVWVKHMGDLKFVSDWSSAEKWALAEERTYDEEGNVTAVRDLGFVIIHSNRRAGYAI